MTHLLALHPPSLAPLAQASSGAGAASGSAEFWVFWIMAPIALGAALSMVLMRNAVHSALMLVLNFFAIAVIYATLEAQFLAVVQVIVYAGAIMVLFLFVIMLLGVVREDTVSNRPWGHKSISALLGVVLFGFLAVGVAGPWMSASAACPQTAASPVTAPDADRSARTCEGLVLVNGAPGGNVAGVGRLLFTDYVWPFEATSALLVIAAISAMVLGRRSEDPARLTEEGQRSAERDRTPVVAGGDGRGPAGDEGGSL